MRIRRELNLRDLGDIGNSAIPKGLFLRSGKLSMFTPNECAEFCMKYGIKCVLDLRTPIEAAEFPDPLPVGVNYLLIPLMKEATIGISHETGSDPLTIIRNLRKHPEQLRALMPDFKTLYTNVVTDEYSRSQLDKAVSLLKENAKQGICTLIHCTAGKDRTGIVSMALLKSYGVSDTEIVKDYMRSNRNVFWPTMKKCIGIGLLTWNWTFVKAAYEAFMANEALIKIAIKNYEK